MLTFIDGSAQGQVFHTERAPRLLRVTHNGTEFRALDGFCDDAGPADIIYIYQRIGPVSGMVTRGKHRHPIARYELCPIQPVLNADHESPVRNYPGWRGWSKETWEKLQQQNTHP